MIKCCKVKDFPEYYITTNGDVYSRNFHRTGRIKKLKYVMSKDGYLTVALYKNKKRKEYRINRLVAETFIPNPENKPEVNHKNGIKTDNMVKNLEWMTRSENCLHKFRVLGHKGSLFGKTGSFCKHSKRLYQIKNGKIINIFYGAEEANRITGINAGHIRSCCYGDRKTAGNYQWRYEDEDYLA